jgi:hypothetical protein
MGGDMKHLGEIAELIVARLQIERALAEQGYRKGQVSPKVVTAMAKRLLRTQEKEEEE